MRSTLLFSDPTFHNGDYQSFFMARMFSFFVKLQWFREYEREACFQEWRTGICKDPALRQVCNIPKKPFSDIKQFNEGLDYVRF